MSELLNALKDRKLWASIVTLLVAFGALQLSDSQQVELVGTITTVVMGLGYIFATVAAQTAEKRIEAETARSAASNQRGIVDFVNSRPQPEPETRLDYGGTPPVHAMSWGTMEGKITSHDTELRAIRQRLNELERERRGELDNAHG